jgi:hypothetical protein
MIHLLNDGTSWIFTNPPKEILLISHFQHDKDFRWKRMSVEKPTEKSFIVVGNPYLRFYFFYNNFLMKLHLFNFPGMPPISFNQHLNLFGSSSHKEYFYGHQTINTPEDLFCIFLRPIDLKTGTIILTNI